MYNYEASFFVWLTEPLYLTKFQKAAICVCDFQGVRDTTLRYGTIEGWDKSILKMIITINSIMYKIYKHK